MICFSLIVVSDRADGASVPPPGTQAAPIEKQVRVKGSFPGPPSPGLGPVMYPPASGTGADRRQNLQPQGFILQLVPSSAWGMNEPPAGLNPQGVNMGKCRRPGVTRALLYASLGLQLANPGEEFRRPRWVAGTGIRSRRIRFTSLHPALTLAATIPAPMAPFSPWPPAPPFASPAHHRGTPRPGRRRRPQPSSRGAADLRCSADPASARLGHHRLLHLRGGQLGAPVASWRMGRPPFQSSPTRESGRFAA